MSFQPQKERQLLQTIQTRESCEVTDQTFNTELSQEEMDEHPNVLENFYNQMKVLVLNPKPTKPLSRNYHTRNIKKLPKSSENAHMSNFISRLNQQ